MSHGATRRAGPRKTRRSGGRGALVIAAALALGPLRAGAQSTEQRAAATAKVVEAERLHEAGDAQASLAKLREAWALYPSPALHFNIGVALRQLDRPAEALAAFESFLRDSRDAPDGGPDLASRRAEAAAYVEELGKRVATLDVVADVAGAEVLVDGGVVGRTPLPRPIAMDPGKRALVVRAPGRVPYDDEVDLTPGTRLRVRARLAVAAPPPRPSLVAAPVPAASSSPPLYRRWWFWTGAAAVAGAAGLAVALTSGGGARGICAPRCTLGEYGVD